MGTCSTKYSDSNTGLVYQLDVTQKDPTGDIALDLLIAHQNKKQLPKHARKKLDEKTTEYLRVHSKAEIRSASSDELPDEIPKLIRA